MNNYYRPSSEKASLKMVNTTGAKKKEYRNFSDTVYWKRAFTPTPGEEHGPWARVKWDKNGVFRERALGEGKRRTESRRGLPHELFREPVRSDQY